jgi:hypothetical protein
MEFNWGKPTESSTNGRCSPSNIALCLLQFVALGLTCLSQTVGSMLRVVPEATAIVVVLDSEWRPCYFMRQSISDNCLCAYCHVMFRIGTVCYGYIVLVTMRETQPWSQCAWKPLRTKEDSPIRSVNLSGLLLLSTMRPQHIRVWYLMYLWGDRLVCLFLVVKLHVLMVTFDSIIWSVNN